MKRYLAIGIGGAGLGLAYLMTRKTTNVDNIESLISNYRASTPGNRPKHAPGWQPISIVDARLYAENAGFTGPDIDTIVQIAQAESSLDPACINDNVNSAGEVTSTDRGILQINDKYHPEVGDYDAFNPVMAFRAAYAISSEGADFSPWVAFNNGSYLNYRGIA